MNMQTLKVKKKTEWYQRLVEDCKEIIKLENLDIIIRKHQLGARILKEKENIPYGQIFSFVKELAKDLDYSWQDLYFSMKFANKYHDVEKFIEDFSNKLENFTWFSITQNLLYEKFTEIKSPEVIKCDLCGGEFQKQEVPSVRLCAFCYAHLLADREAKKIRWLRK
jgi:hypothetical protein